MEFVLKNMSQDIMKYTPAKIVLDDVSINYNIELVKSYFNESFFYNIHIDTEKVVVSDDWEGLKVLLQFVKNDMANLNKMYTAMKDFRSMLKKKHDQDFIDQMVLFDTLMNSLLDSRTRLSPTCTKLTDKRATKHYITKVVPILEDLRMEYITNNPTIDFDGFNFTYNTKYENVSYSIDMIRKIGMNDIDIFLNAEKEKFAMLEREALENKRIQEDTVFFLDIIKEKNEMHNINIDFAKIVLSINQNIDKNIILDQIREEEKKEILKKTPKQETTINRPKKFRLQYVMEFDNMVDVSVFEQKYGKNIIMSKQIINNNLDQQ